MTDRALKFRGIRLNSDDAHDRWYGGMVHGRYVRVWETGQGWIANCDMYAGRRLLQLETDVPASSPEAALRSLLGVIKGAHQSLGRWLEPVRKAKGVERA